MLPPEVVQKLDKKGRFGSTVKSYVDLMNSITGLSYIIASLQEDLDKVAQMTQVAAKEANKAIRTAVAAVPPPLLAPVKSAQPARKSHPTAAPAPPPPLSTMDGYSSDEESSGDVVVAAVKEPAGSTQGRKRIIRNGLDPSGNCGLCHEPGHARGSCRFYHCRGCHRDAPGHTWGFCRINKYEKTHPQCGNCQSNKLPRTTQDF
jgi:hypothetical protein